MVRRPENSNSFATSNTFKFGTNQNLPPFAYNSSSKVRDNHLQSLHNPK